MKGQIFRSPILGIRLYIPDFQGDGQSGPACFSEDMKPDPDAMGQIQATLDPWSRIEAYAHVRDVEVPERLARHLAGRMVLQAADEAYASEISGLFQAF